MRKLLLILGVILLVLLRWAWVQATRSATFTVNSPADVADAAPGDGICETAAGNNVCTLRAAVQESNALPGSDTIMLPAGEFPLTIAGTQEDQAATGDLDVLDDLDIVGAGAGVTIVDGNALDRVFHFLCPGDPYPILSGANSPSCPLRASVGGVTVRNGRSDVGGGLLNGGHLTINLGTVSGNLVYSGGDYSGGGGIRNTGSLTVTGSIVSGNSAPYYGGGIHNARDGTLTVYDSMVSGNSAPRGGGIYNHGTLSSSNSAVSNNTAVNGAGIYQNAGSAIVRDSIISGNSTAGFGGDGGGIYKAGGTMTVISSTINNNSAYYGGGIYNILGTMTISDSIVSSNLAPYGGGIYNDSTLTVINSTISDNSVTSRGGGIYNSAKLAVVGSTLHDNSADERGGALLSGGTLTVTNSTFSGNSATDQGGGIMSYDFAATVSNSTFSGNSAASAGGGIAVGNGGVVTISNSIVANSPSGGDCTGSTITSLGYNLDSDNTCHLTAVGDLPNTNPLLGPLQDNGGPTWTHALLVGSPALDAGNPAVPGSGGNACQLLDQRGELRADLNCDIGATEVQLSDSDTVQVCAPQQANVATFGPTLVQYALNSGDPECVAVHFAIGDAPGAPAYISGSSDQHWIISGTVGTTFDVDLSVPDATVTGTPQFLCSQAAPPAGAWLCIADQDGDGSNGRLARDNVQSFSAWQGCGGAGCAAPTSVRLRSTGAAKSAIDLTPIGALFVLLSIIGTLTILLRTIAPRRRVN